tara:strand:+ start:714 stop:1571 length:858 start_codon:yes stop_codon:yes gene_type:complete
MSHILVTGARGQLGSEIFKISKNYPKIKFSFVGREEMPFDDDYSLTFFLNQINPDIIINTAAYTDVDQAEKEKEKANQINHLSVAAIAAWCSNNSAKLIHVSTDYVFDGTSTIPYKENDRTKPINWYGETKLRGEQAIESILKDAVIIRTSWLYSEFGNNFVKTMFRLMTERKSLNVVNDQIGSPTYALDLAKTIMKIVGSKIWKHGIFHYSNAGKISWFDFAVAINMFSGLNCEVNGVSSIKFPTIAKRPSYSLLDKTKIKVTYKLEVSDWKTSLESCIKMLKR